MADTVFRPTMSDAVIIAERQILRHGGDWIGAIAVYFGFDYDYRATETYLLGGPRRFGQLIGMQPGLVVVDPAPEHRLTSHRGLFVRGDGGFITLMFNPAVGHAMSIMDGFDASLTKAAAVFRCTGGPALIKFGLSFDQWADLTRWLNFWLPE